MKHLYFMRHALSVMNKKGVFSGRTETPLAPEGIEQAHEAGRVARDLGIRLIVSSPMERARETAAIVATEIGYPVEDIVISDLFMERAFGILEGAPYTPDADIEQHEGVESGEEILRRARLGIAYLQALPDETILVVSHGAIGRAMRHILHPDTPYHHSPRFPNAEVIKLL